VKLPTRVVFVVLVGFALSLGTATVAQAQATRTWVSGVGNDANPCSRTAPCKTFAGAISKTATNGEIDALDPGGFGAVTITKSITIDGGSPGLGGILASLVTGVIVNATASSQVVLKNLTINGVANGLDGIRYLAGLSLHLRNVSIDGMTGFCVNFKPTNVGFLFISDSTFTKCAAGGVMVDGTSNFQRASITRTVSDGNLFGFKAFSQALVNITDSTAGAAGDAGYLADGASAKLFAVGSSANLNVTGVKAANNAEVRFFNGSIGHSSTAPTSAVTGGTVTTTGTVFMP
jgi:hypothetical protein